MEEKLTLNDVTRLNNTYSLPNYIIVNRNIVLDSRLLQNLSEDSNRKVIYDFDVYLPKYRINLQRPYVWEHHQQSDFIIDLLLDKPIEPIIVVQYNPESTNEGDNKIINYVIDGKQRLMTIKKFINNKFSIILDGKEYHYYDFDTDTLIVFRNKINRLIGHVYYSYSDLFVTDDMKIKLFNFYNFAGTKQTEEHKIKLQELMNN